MKVLVIDDDRTMQKLIKSTLRVNWAKIEALSASDAAHGLRMFKDEKPDLVILDVNMPGKDGFTLLHELKEVRDTPILIATSMSDNFEVIKTLAPQADDFIFKPFSPTQLAQKLTPMLLRAEKQQPTEQQDQAL